MGLGVPFVSPSSSAGQQYCNVLHCWWLLCGTSMLNWQLTTKVELLLFRGEPEWASVGALRQIHALTSPARVVVNTLLRCLPYDSLVAVVLVMPSLEDFKLLRKW